MILEHLDPDSQLHIFKQSYIWPSSATPILAYPISALSSMSSNNSVSESDSDFYDSDSEIELVMHSSLTVSAHHGPADFLKWDSSYFQDSETLLEFLIQIRNEFADYFVEEKGVCSLP